MVENDKSIKCTKFRKIDQNVDYVSMWCGRRIIPLQFYTIWTEANTKISDVIYDGLCSFIITRNIIN